MSKLRTLSSFEEVKQVIENYAHTTHRNYIKAIISIEKGIDDEAILDKMYDNFMQNDEINLLSEDIKITETIDSLRVNSLKEKLKDIIAVQVGASFAFLDKEKLNDIEVKKSDYILSIENKEYPLYKGKTYQDELKIDTYVDINQIKTVSIYGTIIGGFYGKK